MKALENAKPIHMLIEESLLEAIEDYRYKHRIPKRTEAIKTLLRIGLEGDKKTKGGAQSNG